VIVFDIVFWPAFLYIAVVTAYLAVLTAASYRFKKPGGGRAPVVPPRIAVVIPAHNEASQIAATVRSVREADFPAEGLGVFVIADNCHDDTAAIARREGAEAFERSDPIHRGKGQALDWFFRRCTDAYGAYEVVAIVDADTLVDHAFFQHVAAAFTDPAILVVQGYYGVSNPRDSWRTALSSAALNVFHHLRPAGRNRIGGTAGLKGNGMAFRAGILKTFGWPAFSVVEDIEYSIRLLHEGVLVHYHPDAAVYGEMAADRRQAGSQRQRWEGGRWRLFRTHAPGLLKAWITWRQIRFLDAFFDLFTPPLALLVIWQVLLLVLSLGAHSGAAPVLLGGLATTAAYVVSGLVLKRAPLFVWVCLLVSPVFILWKIPIYLKILRGQDADRWHRTLRKAERAVERRAGSKEDR
jgi:1,2-diacylglycerol 3-beta-glucosyltransferase